MGYEFHTRRIDADLKSLADMAASFYAELGPGTPPDPAVLREQIAYIRAPETIADGLCLAAARVASDPALTSLYTGLTDLSRLKATNKQAGGVMEALALLGAMPGVLEKHRALGVPDSVSRDTFGDMIIAFENYANENGGALGIRYYNEWLYHHFDAELFQVGRLQYLLKAYQGYARLYVDDVTGEAVLTVEAGIAFRGDGLMDGQNDIFSPETRWESELTEDAEAVRTNCLMVNGRAVRTPVVLDKKVWRLALGKGLYGLEMHIPRGGRLTRELCVQSLRDAWRFFRKMVPNQPFEAYYCGSWMLGVGVQNFMPPNSGIVQFQKLYRIYPIRGNEWSFFDRVFGVMDPNAALKDVVAFARTADRSTALRRGVADYLLAGGRLHGGGGVIHQYDLMNM